MEITQTLYVRNRDEWRKWLQENHQTARDIWLVYPRKASGRERISYNHAVEEALCFGWIDSTMKRYDDTSSAQRFSPRRAGSKYSQPNIERLRKMAQQKKLLPTVEASVKPLLDQPYVFPKDIMDAVKANDVAWQHYKQFSPVYQRLKVAFIDSARSRPDEFQKRLRHFIAQTEKNNMYGFGGIEEYF